MVPTGRHGRTLGLALSVLVATGVASGQPAPRDALRAGILAYDELEYEAAIRFLSDALLRPGNRRDEVVLIYQYLGLSYFLLGREDPARGAFQSLLALEPEFRFDQATAPRIIEFLEEVRRDWIARGRPGATPLRPVARRAPVISHVSPPEVAVGGALVLSVRLEDPDRIGRVLHLRIRSGSRGPFETLEMSLQPQTSIRVGGARVEPPSLEYFFELLDEHGQRVASRGDPEGPLRVLVTPGESPAAEAPHRSIASRWWFWTGAALVVAAGAGTAYYLWGRESESTESSWATVRIRVVGPSE